MTPLSIRSAVEDDVEKILEVYDIARLSMRQAGNEIQWLNGYPSRELILSDIAKKQCYVVEDGKSIVAVFALILGEDPTYRRIDGGQWLNDEPYGTIHRIGSDGVHHGIIKLSTEFALTKADNLRIDTHECNGRMKHVLEKNGFIRCGIIYIADGTPRVAYHKTK